MKRIFVFLIIILLGTIVFFQVKSYRKFSSTNAYDYTINTKDIDINYYDQKLVLEYFEVGTKLGNFAREQWINHKIDVLSPENDNIQSINASQTYQKMLSRIKFIEAKLIASQKIKAQGFNNDAIAYIEKHGISEKQYAIHSITSGKTFKKGDKDIVIWEVQKLINQKGVSVQIDGFFSDETELAIKKIQEQKQVYPSGVLDESFVKLLY
ncbi:MAG: hypothetical protein MUC49_18345 [Raineya sp.]|jgi:hypothetical protein|nr:hypothetical protein [Raineya sp.]